jgi:hypothetical protein
MAACSGMPMTACWSRSPATSVVPPGSGPAASPGSPGVGLAAAGNPVAVHGLCRAGSGRLGAVSVISPGITLTSARARVAVARAWRAWAVGSWDVAGISHLRWPASSPELTGAIGNDKAKHDPARSLRMRSAASPGRGGQQPGQCPSRAGRAPVRRYGAGADHVRGLGLGQRLEPGWPACRTRAVGLSGLAGFAATFVVDAVVAWRHELGVLCGAWERRTARLP